MSRGPLGSLVVVFFFVFVAFFNGHGAEAAGACGTRWLQSSAGEFVAGRFLAGHGLEQLRVLLGVVARRDNDNGHGVNKHEPDTRGTDTTAPPQ